MRSSCFFGQVGKAIGKAGDVITIKLESPRLWSPDDPFLYKIQVGRKKNSLKARLQLLEVSDQVGLSSGDLVNSYAGLRTTQVATEGEKQIMLLNGKPLDFQVATNNHT